MPADAIERLGVQPAKEAREDGSLAFTLVPLAAQAQPDMRKLVCIVLLLPLAASAGNSLCAPNEQVLFSCPAGKAGRMLSLCASSRLERGTGYLQYRYGTIGNVEFTYPESATGSQEKFRYAHYFRFQNDRTQVSFANRGFNYVIFTSHDGEARPEIEEQGVLVSSTTQPEQEKRIPCKRPATETLARLAAILPCDEENPLASCQPSRGDAKQ